MFLLTLCDLFYHFLCQVSRVASVTDVSASPALDQYCVLSPSSSVPHCMFKACVFSLDFHRGWRSGLRHRSRGHLRRVSRVAMSHLHGESPLTSSGYSLHLRAVFNVSLQYILVLFVLISGELVAAALCIVYRSEVQSTATHNRVVNCQMSASSCACQKISIK